MSYATSTIGGVKVAKVGHGLMTMTWVPTPVPDDVCFETIKAGVDALPQDVKMFLNAGEFYAQDMGTANLEMLSRFFEKYPAYADRTFLSVKGGVNMKIHGPDASPENLRASVDNILRALRGTKKLDLFESARVDQKVPIEQAMETLQGLIAEGKFSHIGLSECKAETVRRAAKVAPIAAVEIEVSPLSYEEETKKVIEACGELGIAVVGYSPVGRGLLTGAITKLDDLPENDNRRNFDRFQSENIDHNLKIASAIKSIADAKGATLAQVSIAWVSALGPHVIPLPGSSKSTRVLENLGGAKFTLSPEEVKQVTNAVEDIGVKGQRYHEAHASSLWG